MNWHNQLFIVTSENGIEHVDPAFEFLYPVFDAVSDLVTMSDVDAAQWNEDKP